MEGRVLLGEGTFGKVYKVREIGTNKSAVLQGQAGRMVAMKVMKLDEDPEGIPATTLREVALLKMLEHPHIVRLLDVQCDSPANLVLVFEFLDHDLRQYMKTQSMRLSPGTIKNLSHQLCLGVEYCHSHRVMHRDLKPQNLLIDVRLRVLKIADFGLARAFMLPVPVYTHEVVTLWYRAPEILLGDRDQRYSLPVDVWSIGCVIGEMATGAPLFGGDSEIGTILQIFNKLGTPDEAMWPGITRMPNFKATFPQWPPRGWPQIRNTLEQVGEDGIELLEHTLRYNPCSRISARSALLRSYFLDVDASALD